MASGEKKTPDVVGVEKPNCPMDRESLGHNTWTLLHSMAAWYPCKPSKELQKDAITFMHTLSRLYPCEDCAEELRKRLKESPPEVDTREKFEKWVCLTHNDVNSRLGRPIFDCSSENLAQRWRDGWKDGSCD